MAVKDGLPSTDFSRMNREWVKSVADSAGGGLPDITEADEGKVLTVESGEAAWAEAVGSDSLILTVDNWEGDPPTISQSWNDIAAALANNKPVYVFQVTSNDGNITEATFYIVNTATIIEGKYQIYVNFDADYAFAKADTPNEPMEIVY